MYTSTEQTPDIYKWANSEWHHFDPLGTAGVITNGSASVISNNVYDLFGVLRYEQGNAQTPWRWGMVKSGEEGLYLLAGSSNTYLPEVVMTLNRSLDPVYVGCVIGCMVLGHSLVYCLKKCAGVPDIPPAPAPRPPQPTPQPCPPGTCPFKCPGAKDYGCGQPGTTIQCPDGTSIPLPEDCANQGQPPKEPPKQLPSSGVSIRAWCTEGLGIAICIRF